MTRDQKRNLLENRQGELMRKEGKETMLVKYGDGLGQPGFCVTIENSMGDVDAHWFGYAEQFGDVDEWLAEQGGDE